MLAGMKDTDAGLPEDPGVFIQIIKIQKQKKTEARTHTRRGSASCCKAKQKKNRKLKRSLRACKRHPQC